MHTSPYKHQKVRPPLARRATHRERCAKWTSLPILGERRFFGPFSFFSFFPSPMKLFVPVPAAQALLFCFLFESTAGWATAPSIQVDGRRCQERCRSPTAGLSMIHLLKPVGYESKRAKRRRRAPPSELQEWLTSLSVRPGGLKLMLDLDNNADAVPQLEAAQVSPRPLA